MSLRSHRNLFIVQRAPGEEEQQSRVEKRLEEEKKTKEEKTKKVGREVAMAHCWINPESQNHLCQMPLGFKRASFRFVWHRNHPTMAAMLLQSL